MWLRLQVRAWSRQSCRLRLRRLRWRTEEVRITIDPYAIAIGDIEKEVVLPGVVPGLPAVRGYGEPVLSERRHRRDDAKDLRHAVGGTALLNVDVDEVELVLAEQVAARLVA